MPVQYVNRPDHTFRGYAGTIAAGRVRPGDRLVNAAAQTEASVARIVTMDGDLHEAGAGEPVTLVLDREIDISRGDVLAAGPPPAAADGLDSWVVWMDETPLFRGRAYLLMLGTPHRRGDDDRNHHAPGYGDAGRNQRPRTGSERDWPCRDLPDAIRWYASRTRSAGNWVASS